MYRYYLKWQQETLKALAEHENGKRPKKPFYEYKDGFFLIAHNTSNFYMIPQNQFFLNAATMHLTDGLGKLLKDDGYKPAEETGNLAQLKTGIGVEIAAGGSSVWVNEKLLRSYGKNLCYKIKGSRDGVLIYNSLMFPLGLLLPVIVKENKEV